VALYPKQEAKSAKNNSIFDAPWYS